MAAAGVFATTGAWNCRRTSHFSFLPLSDAVQRPPQGIELYKENLALGDRLTAYYATVQTLPALQNIINFPQLAPLPADFLTAMEDYVREAPKEVDPSLSSGRRGSGPLAGNK